MRSIFLLLLTLSRLSFAHDEHGTDLKAKVPASGASILQLGSVWRNQRGENINLADLKGTPRLVVMLFTRCDTACPLIVEDLKEITREIDAKRSSKTDVSIFSLDSFRESPESLADFSKKRNLPSHWGLYTSNADAVAELAAALGLRYKRLPDGDFIHSNAIYFLNGKGEVFAQKEGIKSPRTEFIKKILRGF